jgi:branched-chain amino acid transport system permease protein
MKERAWARDAAMLAGLGAVIVAVFVWFGPLVTVQLLISAITYALVALGLNIQWGYGGQFNFAVMGLMMLGGYAVVAASYPLNGRFWESEGPAMLGGAIVAAAVGAALVIGAHQVHRIGITGNAKAAIVVAAWAIAYFAYRSQIDPATTLIEAEAGFIGGLGLPVGVGWAFGGALAAAIAYFIGKICLGLRTDYLAIATIGISEIIRALLKNMDWLTRGTLTVSPLPWPTPLPLETGIQDRDLAVLVGRSMFLSVIVVLTAIIFVLLQRAYYAPWGRMMRAIRDDPVAADAMGKDVKTRQLQLFVLGAALIGVGGAVMSTYSQLYDPAGYQPIDYTFLVWVMVIVGGAGNNLGAIFGAALIMIAWTVSDPLSQILFQSLDSGLRGLGWGSIPDVQSRALQMRVFFLGLLIVLSLRYAPRGLIPERFARQP